MYTEESRRSINWGNVLKKCLIAILIIAIILLIIWLFTKNNSNAVKVNNTNNTTNNNVEPLLNTDAYSEVFITNYNHYHDTAKDYFVTNELPKNGQTIKYSIQELINKKILLKVRYENSTCDLDSSYIGITNNNEVYTMTTLLICGKESVKTTETLACSKLCENCKSVTEYQYKQAYNDTENVYNCPSGYTKSGSGSNTTCIKSDSVTIKPTKTITYICPEGSTKSGSGENTVCSVSKNSTVNPTVNTTYSCPSGYTKSGSGSSTTCTKSTTDTVNAATKTTYSCASGYTLNGSKCVKTDTVNAIPTTTYSCSKGTLVNTKYCRIYSTKEYYDTYTTYKGKTYGGCTYSGSYVDSCSTGSNCSSVYYKYFCSTSSYKDTAATAKTIYSCASGYTLSGDKCTKSTSVAATAKTAYSCASGYTLSGSKCTKSTSVAATAKTAYSCASGYTLSGSKCTKTTSNKVNPTTTTSYNCPSGYTKNNNVCTANTSSTVNVIKNIAYTCASDYTKVGIGSSSTCIKGSSTTTEPTVTTKSVTKYKYKWSTETSLSGWTRTGETRQTKVSSN